MRVIKVPASKEPPSPYRGGIKQAAPSSFLSLQQSTNSYHDFVQRVFEFKFNASSPTDIPQITLKTDSPPEELEKWVALHHSPVPY